MNEERKMIMDITLGSDPMPDIINVEKNGQKTRFVIDGPVSKREIDHIIIVRGGHLQ